MHPNWRKEITIALPILRYHPPRGAAGTVVRIQPTTSIGPKQGIGLTKDAHPPSRMSHIPGGILDSAGLHIPFIDIDAPNRIPLPFEFGFRQLIGIVIGGYRYRYHFGEPQQLPFEEYKAMVLGLHYKEKRMPRPSKRMRNAETVFDIMAAEFGEEDARKYRKDIVVKNWIDEPRRYPIKG